MNKNELIKRLKEQETAYQLDEYLEGYNDGISVALELAVRLDEPETLSPEWIDERKRLGHFQSGDGIYFGYFIKAEELQNQLVPKQEEAKEFDRVIIKHIHDIYDQYGYDYLPGFINDIKDGLVKLKETEKPVVPQFVADFIKENKGRLNMFGAFIDIRDNEDSEMWEWMFNNYNQDEFAKVWLAYPNIEVEKEQKYCVKDDKGNILLRKVTKGFGIGDRKGKVVNSLNAGEASDIELTEKEIKDYDPKYMTFAEPVEEEEE